MAAAVHKQSTNGFSDESSDYYDKARPSYPLALYSYIRERVGRNRKPLNIAEIGSGTGIFTRGLLNHLEWQSDIAELRAVEPSPGMREAFSNNVVDDKVSVSDGTFESTGIPDRWADLIVIATAFHWCLDFDKAILEFCRILKSDGSVFLIWNSLSRWVFHLCIIHYVRAPWISKLWEISDRYDPEGFVRASTNTKWRKLYDSPVYQKRMKFFEERVFQYDQAATQDTVIRRVLSWSAIVPLSEKEKERIRNEVLDVLQESLRETKDWIDQPAGVFKFPHDSLVVSLYLYQ